MTHQRIYKYNLRDKFDISEIIDIFTCEDIIIIFTCEDIVLFLSISYHSVYPGGNERPSHNPLFWTILSKSVAHVTIHFDRVSECSVRPFDESSVIYLHCIDLSTEKFTLVTSFGCMEICCELGHFSSSSNLAVRRLCFFLWSKESKVKLSEWCK